MKLHLNDVWHLYGSYPITDEQQNPLAYAKLSNGYKGRLITRLFRNDGTMIAEMQAPTLIAIMFRLQIRNPNGDELGLIQQRVRLDKITNRKQEGDKKSSSISNFFKWYVGMFAEFSFKGNMYEVETSWPFFDKVLIKNGDRILMKFNRFVSAPLLDFLFLRKYIPKLPYEVEVLDPDLSEEDSLMMALTVRQWIRHRRHHHHE